MQGEEVQGKTEKLYIPLQDTGGSKKRMSILFSYHSLYSDMALKLSKQCLPEATHSVQEKLKPKSNTLVC